MTTEQIERLVRAHPWHHDWEIAPGVRTNGTYNPEPMLKALGLPADMTGVKVADVGASNGFFSFALRRRGASVVAFDYRHKDNSGFGLAQFIDGITGIPHEQVNVLDLRADKYGMFDVVLALGLVYHTPDPYMALARCASMAQDRLLVEAYCDGAADGLSMRFLPDPERFPGMGQPNGDRSNFWRFSPGCLTTMLDDLGFVCSIVTLSHDRVLIDARRLSGVPNRLDLAYGVMPRVPVSGHPAEPESWTIF